MKILVVDDEPMNVELLEEYLTSEGFDVISAEDGQKGIDSLRENRDVCVILLDKMMPNINGMEFLERLHIDPELSDIPVIMQTAAADEESIVEGVNAGIYYYLTKPYKKDLLVSVVKAAIDDTLKLKNAIEEVHKNKHTLAFLVDAVFEISTLQQAQNLAYLIANSFPDPEKVVLGLSEILINAVEHGNLGLGYKEKSVLMANGKLTEELKRREKLPENINKIVKVSFRKDGGEVVIKVTDEGKGFNWREFLSLSPERAVDPNGRGIIMSKMMSFDAMEYNETGNEVCCRVSLKEKKSKVA